ncbi:MAG: CpsD/CapB family tyrosine-protein kinase [Pseudomonadota bacterium]
MEKLQAALAKARSQRATRAGGTAPAFDRKAPRAADTPTAWETLKRIELSPKELSKHRIVSQQAARSSSNFDVLRTKALLQMQQNGWSRLAITSPGSGSGKSTIACNLALGLGRQSNLRTMLFDFDLGDPSVHRFFGIEHPHTLSQVLSGEVAFADHALRVSENVAVVISPVREADPTRLILSDKMPAYLDQVQAEYQPDIMLFDLPAILSGDRARAFLKHTDCALIVARAERTSFSDLDVTENEVAESTNVLGVVVNGCHAGAMPREEE